MKWWWCLIILGIGGCRGELAADSAAIESSAAVARVDKGGCISYRPLSDVIWGFLVTLLALAVSLWGSWKHANDGIVTKGLTILLSLFAPLWDLGRIVKDSLRCVSLLWKCQRMKSPDSRMTSLSWLKFLCSSLFPWSKSSVRILANCDIVVYVFKESPLLQKEWLWLSECKVYDESEAMIVGENGARATRDHEFERMQLSQEGLGWLLWKEVFFQAQEKKRLPKHNELKYLRGNSGFAVIAIAVQALGYLYAVGFRIAKKLRISPIEILEFIFNIILLMKALCYSTCNPCHRPLVIYMDKDWEDDFDKVNDIDFNKLLLHPSKKLLASIQFGIFVTLSSMLIYLIVKMVVATNVSVTLPVIVFFMGLCLQFLGILYEALDQYDGVQVVAGLIAISVNVVVYIWAIAKTMLYWETMLFNVQGELINLSQVIPFIG